MSIVNIAEETFTSPATVSRKIKKCGVNGFMELRYNLSKRKEEINSSKDINEIFSKSLIETRQTLENISVNQILEIIELIQKSKKIIVIARGLSELVATEFSLKLELMDFNVFNISDPNIMKKLYSIYTKRRRSGYSYHDKKCPFKRCKCSSMLLRQQ